MHLFGPVNCFDFRQSIAKILSKAASQRQRAFLEGVARIHIASKWRSLFLGLEYITRRSNGKGLYLTWPFPCCPVWLSWSYTARLAIALQILAPDVSFKGWEPHHHSKGLLQSATMIYFLFTTGLAIVLLPRFFESAFAYVLLENNIL